MVTIINTAYVYFKHITTLLIKNLISKRAVTLIVTLI